MSIAVIGGGGPAGGESKAAPGEAVSKFGGVSVGTGLAILGEHIGGSWGTALLYAAPAISYMVGWMLLTGNAWADKQVLQRKVAELRRDAKVALESPYLSDDQKLEVRKDLASIEMDLNRAKIEHVRLIAGTHQRATRMAYELRDQAAAAVRDAAISPSPQGASAERGGAPQQDRVE